MTTNKHHLSQFAFDLIELTALRGAATFKARQIGRAIDEIDSDLSGKTLTPHAAANAVERRTGLLGRWQVWNSLYEQFNAAHIVAAQIDAGA